MGAEISRSSEMDMTYSATSSSLVLFYFIPSFHDEDYVYVCFRYNLTFR